MQELPKTIQLAMEVVDLPGFLEDVPVGFHWDILDRLEEGVYITDGERRIMYWSAGAERITGYKSDETLGRRCSDNLLKHVDAKGRCLCTEGCPLTATMLDGQPRSVEVFLHHKLGHRVPVRVYGVAIRDREGRIIGCFETFADTTPKLAYIERIQSLKELAFVDSLTGLANRRFVQGAIESRVLEMQRVGLGFGVVMGDVDHFKKINDQYGHQMGDQVLQMVGQTLSGSCRGGDIVGRWGGEEFMIVAGAKDLADVSRVAERARALVEQSELQVDGKRLQVTMSLGVTLARAGEDVESVIARADKLLYRSKEGGRNQVTAG